MVLAKGFLRAGNWFALRVSEHYAYHRRKLESVEKYITIQQRVEKPNQMETPSSDEVTRLLKAWSIGDETALGKLLPLVDDELRKIAHAYLRRERPGHDLDEAELINEAFLRFITEPPQIEWQGRAQFFSIAARRMREILIDYARSRLRVKRGGRSEHFPLTEAATAITQSETRLELLSLALDRLAKLDERKSDVVLLRYFGGFTMEETAQVLGFSLSTVEREWRFARAWLKQELGGEQGKEAKYQKQKKQSKKRKPA